MSAPINQNTLLSDRNRLIEAELEALFQVGRVLSRSLHLQETLEGVLRVLHNATGMHYGMVTLRDKSGELAISALYCGERQLPKPVHYRSNEGVIGAVIESRKTIVIKCIGDEPRFLDRLGLYDSTLPFIGVPIYLSDEEPIGVLMGAA